MGKIDPRLDFIRSLQPAERLHVANRAAFMAPVGQPAADEIPELRIQVFIQVRDPSRGLLLPGVHIRSRMGDILTAQVTPESVDSLDAEPNVLYVERAGRVLLEGQSRTSEAPTIEIGSGPLDESGNGVIIGIVDWGCDFTHGDFRDESGSRILYFWDQLATPGPGQQPPHGYSGGVEFDKVTLDRALQEPDPFAALGIEAPEPASHGTHVMGIAAGSGREDPEAGVRGIAPEADLIFVQPNTGDYDIVGGFGDSVNLAEAVKYVFDKAADLGRPAAVNLSMGTNYGPHDGTTLVEQWIDRLLGAPGRAVVLALGNEHHQRWNRTHSEGNVATGETTTLYWRVLPGDSSPNEMEIWYGARDVFVVEVIPPNGAAVPIVEPGDSGLFDIGHVGTRVYISNDQYSPLNGDNRINVIVVSPSETPVEPGVWQLRLTSRVSREGSFDAWIERDASRPPYQSSFVGGSYIRRKTLGSIQSARHAITVSNYDSYTITLADSTSVGPTRDGRRAPIVAAPGVEILSANSRYHAAEDPLDRTPYISKTGTSMSAPHVAGVVACMFEKNNQLTAAQLKGLLAAAAKPAPGIGPEYRPDWGHGRVDPVDTLTATWPAPSSPTKPPIEPAPCPVSPVHDEGPFYREGAPFTNDLYPEDSTGPVLHFRGTVSDTDCTRLAGVTIHVWHADYGGRYDNDDSSNPPAPDFFRCRARMISDADGVFELRTVLPANYQPDPVGLPEWTRVRHLHFKFFLQGFAPHTTEVCFEPDDYLESDFWLNRDLVTHLTKVPDGDDANVSFRAGFDFTLKPISARGYVDRAIQLGLLPGSRI
ncbi:MAG: S8 family serine peptidase [Pseudonocardiaceae bacterium]